MFTYIDIHSHLYFPEYDSDREAEIQKIKEANIATITIGTGADTSRTAVTLAERHGNLFACVGQHPGDMTGDSVFDEEISSLAQHPRTVAIGECGLDYFRMSYDDSHLKAVQKKIFESHIDLSLSVSKPLMLHIRSSKGTEDAYEDALDILESRTSVSGDSLRGNAHFFAGSLETLKRFIAIGFTVSFTGVITFAHDYDELIRYTPLTMIMSETDAPFVAPVPYRGMRNSPLYVPGVVSAIARIRGEDLEIIKTALRDNAIRQFGLAGSSVASREHL